MSNPFNTIKLYRHLRSANNIPLLKELAKQATGEVRDEMAVPAYFQGNFLSRLLFFGRLARFLQPLDITSSATVLDFGCGIGLLAPYFVNYGCRYCGIDLTTTIAQSYASSLGLHEAVFHHSLAELAPDQKFDHIVSFDVLEHVDNLEETIQKFSSLLTHRGSITICGPTENLLYRLGRKLVGFSGEYHHRNIDDIFQTAEKSGLIAINERSWPLPGPATLFKCRYYIL